MNMRFFSTILFLVGGCTLIASQAFSMNQQFQAIGRGVADIGDDLARAARQRREAAERRQRALRDQQVDLNTIINRNADPDAVARARAQLQQIESELGVVNRAQERNAILEDRVANMATDLVGQAGQVFVNNLQEADRLKREVATAAASAGATAKANNAGQMDRLKLLTSKENIMRMSLAVGGVGAALLVTYFVAKYGYFYAQKFLGMPKLVRESSDKGLFAQLGSLFGEEEDTNANMMSDIVLEPELEKIIRELAQSTLETKKDGLPFRNLCLYGEPGTGKTMLAKKIARYSGMDYAILSGADFSQFEEGKDVEQLHLLFDRADKSEKGLIVFIDEADAFLRDRKELSNRGQNLVNAFLSRTGEKSKNFMLIIATNHPQNLDSAVISRISKKVHIALPGAEERAKIVKLYLEKYFVKQATMMGEEQASIGNNIDETYLRSFAEQLSGFSGRDLEDLVGELRYTLSRLHTTVVSPEVMAAAASEKLQQRKEVATYNGNHVSAAAAHAAANLAVSARA